MITLPLISFFLLHMCFALPLCFLTAYSLPSNPGHPSAQPSPLTTSTTIKASNTPASYVLPSMVGLRSCSGLIWSVDSTGQGFGASFLLLRLASWIRLSRAPDKRIDPNTWAHLAFLNWAVTDLIQQIALLQSYLSSQSIREHVSQTDAIE